MDRGHYNYGRASGGASLVATINPSSANPNIGGGVKKHNNMMGSSILPNNIVLGAGG